MTVSVAMRDFFNSQDTKYRVALYLYENKGPHANSFLFQKLNIKLETLKSITSREDKSFLLKNNYIRKTSGGVELTPKGRKFVETTWNNYYESQKYSIQTQQAEIEDNNRTELILQKTREYLDSDEKIVEYYRIQSHYEINFKDLSKFDLELANELIENPSDVISAFRMVIDEMNPEVNKIPDPDIIIRGRPNFKDRDSFTVKDEDKLVTIRAKIIGTSDKLTKITNTRFECPACGNVIPILQLDKKFAEPTKCSCGRKGKFRMISSEKVDHKKITISPYSKGRFSNKHMSCFIDGSLSNQTTKPGEEIYLTGINKSIPMHSKRGERLNVEESIIEVFGIEVCGLLNQDYKFSDKEIQLFKEISKKPFAYICKHVFGEWEGYLPVKHSLTMVPFSIDLSKNNKYLTPLKMLIVGVPGLAKSKLARKAASISRISDYCDMTNTSGVGLVGMAREDPNTGGYFITGGTIPYCHKGVAVVDEIDKAQSHDDLNRLHTYMSEGFIPIRKGDSKENVQCDTALIAIGNPKNDEFDSYKPNHKQIENTRGSMLSRFDVLIFIEDSVDGVKDAKIAEKVIQQIEGDDFKESESLLLIKKYCLYAQTIEPRLSDQIKHKLINFYVELRKTSNSESYEGKKIDPRVLMSLVKQSLIVARIHLSSEVTEEHVKFVIDHNNLFMERIGVYSNV